MAMAIDEGVMTQALAAIERVWSETELSPWTLPPNPQVVGRLPTFTEAAAKARAALGRRLLAEIDAVDAGKLPRDLAATLGVARDLLAVEQGRRLVLAGVRSAAGRLFRPLRSNPLHGRLAPRRA